MVIGRHVESVCGDRWISIIEGFRPRLMGIAVKLLMNQVLGSFDFGSEILLGRQNFFEHWHCL